MRCGVLLILLGGCGGGGSGDETVEPDDGLISVPGGTPGARGVKLAVAGDEPARWCVYRTWPQERLHFMVDCDRAEPRRLRFDRADAGELLLLASRSIGTQMVAAVYDARRNIPSGRVPGVLDDGVDLIRFDAASPDREPESLGARLPLGGFDNHLFIGRSGSRVLVCALRTCHALSPGGPAETWPSTVLSGYELVEVQFDDGGAQALVRREMDGYSGWPPGTGPAYAVARLTSGGATITPISEDCLPWDLRVGPLGPQWRCVRSQADAAELMAFDLRRMPHGGLMDYGASNLEGRIAWSQAYYLPTLARWAEGSWPQLAAPAQQAEVRARVRHETELLARRHLQADGYASRRYSYGRTAVTFALHLGRIARTLSEVSQAGLDSASTGAARERLHEQLLALDTTAETQREVTWRGRTTTALAYRRGIDFWADGATVPYNYISGYVSGLLAAPRAGTEEQRRSRDFMASLLVHEAPGAGTSWNYWWSNGFDGWPTGDDVSTHTPQYGGSRQLAHITYRTMDAAALLELHQQSPGALPPDLPGRLAALMRQGALLPSLSQQLRQVGLSVRLDPEVAYRFARSTGSWELASQPWALVQWLERPGPPAATASRIPPSGPAVAAGQNRPGYLMRSEPAAL